VRNVPDLAFLADRSGRFQARIEQLMDRSRKRQKPVSDESAAPVVPSDEEALAGKKTQPE
jgi:hypothetical protein